MFCRNNLFVNTRTAPDSRAGRNGIFVGVECCLEDLLISRDLFRIMADLGLPTDTVDQTSQDNCDILPATGNNFGFDFLIYNLLV